MDNKSNRPEPVGSSPHTRGLPDYLAAGEDEWRIIPAHAGFTAHEASQGGRHTDHPRTRGVYRTYCSA